MKNLILNAAIICSMLISVSTAQAQCGSRCAKKCNKETDVVSQINIELKNSIQASVITVDKDGYLKQKDSNGNTFEYSLKDVKEINAENDNYKNLVIHFERGKKANGIVGGKKVQSKHNTLAFSNPNDCKKTITLFKKLVAKYN
jgi:hypothetical protein